MRLVKKNFLLALLDGSLISYSVPSNISYWWNFGSLAGIVLASQIVTGIFLAMHYTPHIDYAFLSVEHIMRDVNYGWLLRYLHANGASMFFIAIYTHIARGLYYGSYSKPRHHVWLSGVLIFLLSMATAFMGYVLPYGQMSLWGSIVITNLFSAVPYIGSDIVIALWGGYSVGNPTLNRFFALHYLLPFIILAMVIVHIALLHQHGSNNPLGISAQSDTIPFYPYFIVKDLFGLVLFFIFFGYFVFYNPNLLGHSDNYIPANPLVTPSSIVPEWYFLPFYAILRSIPHKLGGVVAMISSILILMTIPFIAEAPTRGSTFRPIYKFGFWFFLGTVMILGWVGGNHVEDPFILIGQVATIIYFLYFLLFLPILARIEHLLFTVYSK